MEHHEKKSLGYLLLVALFGLVALWFIYEMSNKQPAPVTTLEDETEAAIRSSSFDGSLYLTAETDNIPGLAIYRYDFSERTFYRELSQLLLLHVAPISNDISAAFVQDSEDGDMKPALVNNDTAEVTFLDIPDYAIERDLTVSPDRTSIAYSASTVVSESDWAKLNNWQVVIASLGDTTERIVIENAAHPQWLRDGNTLVYVKEDGVYSYNLTTQAESLLVSQYNNLSFFDDISLSGVGEDGEVLMTLTLPSLRTLDLLYISTDNEAVLVNQIETASGNFTDPVVAPDGSAFAVLARSNFGKETILEIRSGANGEVLTTLDIEGSDSEKIFIDMWSLVE